MQIHYHLKMYSNMVYKTCYYIDVPIVICDIKLRIMFLKCDHF